MQKRMNALFGVAAAALASVACGSVSGQTDKAASDLSGTWAQKYQIPLQRSARDAGKALLTEEEVAQREAERNQPKPPTPIRQNPNAKRGTYDDLIGAYDAVFGGETEDPGQRRPIGRQTSLIVDPPEGRIPAQTAAVKQRTAEMRRFQLDLMQSVELCKDRQDINCYGVKYTGKVSPRRNDPPPSYLAAQMFGDRVLNRADNPEDYGLSERCLSGRLPVMGAIQRIVQSPDAVSINYEGFQRVIPITDSPHLPSTVRLRFGDARGHWEGNTLVVDVTNFTPKTDYEGSRENLHLIERFTRTDANTLEYTVRLEDPTTWEKPWTVRVEMARQDDKKFELYDEPRCHDGNYALMDMLIGSRADDKAFAEGRGPNPATLCYLICGNGDPAYAATRMRGRGYEPVDGTPEPAGRP